MGERKEVAALHTTGTWVSAATPTSSTQQPKHGSPRPRAETTSRELETDMSFHNDLIRDYQSVCERLFRPVRLDV